MSGMEDNGPNKVTAMQLCGYVSWIERIEGEIAEMNTDKKDVYAEAKSVGFDVPTLKRVIQRRRKDRQEVAESDQLLDFYEGIINGTLGKANAPKEKDPFD